MPTVEAPLTGRRAWAGQARQAFALLVALGSILGYRAVGREYYEDFRVPHGTNIIFVPPTELAGILLFCVFGLTAVVSLTWALRETSLTAAVIELLRRLPRRAGAVAAATALVVFASCLWIASFQLANSVTTDDEHVYRFIAQTLRSGSLTAPSPGRDLEMFREQFVVLDEQVRYGKFPIGHPLLLALGQALGAEALIVPAITGLLAWPLYFVACTLYGRPTAVLALLLFASSPQVLLTGATFLSQPASALCMLGGLGCLLASEREGARGTVWLSVAGGLLGLGLLVRPLPGALFILVALSYLVGRLPRRRTALPAWCAFLGPLLAFACAILVINRVQAGGLLTTGYQALQGVERGTTPGLLATLGGSLAAQAMSVVAAIVRSLVWPSGWPFSIALAFFAARHPRRHLLWAMVAADWLYRLLSPKAGAAGTGPLYLFEALPLMCILMASGVRELARRSQGGLRGTSGGAALLLAGGLVSLTMFLPARFADLRRMGSAQLTAPAMIAQRGIHHAVVFHQMIVPYWMGLSWAYFPRCNSPRLDDDILFLRASPEVSSLEQALEMWKRRYPDRTAWYFGWAEKPFLTDLESYVREVRARQGAPGLLPIPPPP